MDEAAPRRPLCELVAVGQEVARPARERDAPYLTAHIRSGAELHVSTVDGRTVSVTGHGFEVELSIHPEWRRLQPGR